MATVNTGDVMTESGRALLTEREREILSGEADVSRGYYRKTKSVVRARVERHLDDDLEFLKENFPEVHDLVIDEVCDD